MYWSKISVPAPKRIALFPANEYFAIDGFATSLVMVLLKEESKEDSPVDFILTKVDPIEGAVISKENCPTVLPFLSF